MEYFLLAVLLVSVPIAQAAEEANNKILDHLLEKCMNNSTPLNIPCVRNFKADEYSRVLVPDGMKICLDFYAYHIRKHLSTLPKQIRKSFCQSKDWTGHVTEREERYDLLGTSHISIYKNELEFEACLPRYCFNVKTNALKWVEHPIEDSLKKIPANEAMKAVSPPILTFLILFHLIKTMTI
ncbi:hypothetical protein DMENIID0001_154740 [Sergentomyia squamirostris]